MQADIQLAYMQGPCIDTPHDCAANPVAFFSYFECMSSRVALEQGICVLAYES
jgi:hypothetical protein